ncbi:HAMP domain-containing sensor histidine kinase [Fredinandcohnia sp. QZ13]|uniref:sensor histidine kinase n=1 Tax=Fredinandcohnia sp. QZ13 TaxID=3073144 RepID=UPI0028535BC3|nr:HAMP domain-containing sensor histidine kinase [Fredinandcohnia sp. QZ13]MDR4887835.1 HAMP domain-containing sensor histidine kinase [Fredinandcohnia sp. QZ13]
MKGIGIRNRLIGELLVAVAISLFASIALILLSIQFILNPYVTTYPTGFSTIKYNVMTFLVFSVAILTFILVFLIMVRKKIKYLRLISESVNYIASGKLGLTIGIEGNDELTQLAKNINEMSRELENRFNHARLVEVAKNELITNVSHDLRTPLTSILGYIDLLKRGQYSSNQLEEYIETIHSKTRRLKYLIDELFEYTRLSSPDVRLNLTEMDLARLLEQIVGEYIPVFENEQITVRKSIPDEEISISMDVEKMVRVYENLFMNAVKYSKKPSELKISLEKKDSQAILKVSNRVEKPPVSDINKLFDRFFRGDKARKDTQGTGLGLAISKRTVELHNGSIYADYKEGWITFIVEHSILR